MTGWRVERDGQTSQRQNTRVTRNVRTPGSRIESADLPPRQILLGLYRRSGFETAAVCFNLCPHLIAKARVPDANGMPVNPRNA